jgi:tetratricopeptide (TPR) repeat protein
MHYFRALDHFARNEHEKARQHLAEGAKADPSDADVLIALYRLPNQTEEQQAHTRKLIRDAADQFQKDVLEHARQLAQLQAQLPNIDMEIYRRQLAMDHNQFAWLVSNTEGDYDAAIASSHESLKLRPGEPAYLDTLGRCYYATGDLASAIKYQTQAVRKEPFSGQMARQLAMFKSAAEKKK